MAGRKREKATQAQEAAKIRDEESTSSIRVLHFVSTLSRGSGVMSVIMNYYRHMDRAKVQFDFLSFLPCEDAYEEEIKNLGGRTYRVDKPGSSIKSIKQLDSFFRLHAREYVWLHNHEVYLTFLLRPLSKRHGLKRFIVHCHATRYSDKPLNALRNRLFCLPIGLMKVERFACSEAAGRFLYGKRSAAGEVFVMHNAIDCEKFRFRPEVRERMRREMGLEGKFVIGHVGRFERQKNHEFLLEVFGKCKKENDNCFLLLIGEGLLQTKIEKQATERGLGNSILFLEKRNDMEFLYQGMDVFVLPSLYEGLPVSCVEAQMNGLVCIISDTITNEFGKNIKGGEIISLPLKKSIWKCFIMHYKIREINEVPHINSENYNIYSQSHRLFLYYTGNHA